MEFFGKFIKFIEKQPMSFGGWAISFFVLLALNLFFQFITYGFNNVSFEYFIGAVIQPYYFILYLAVVIFLYLVTESRPPKAGQPKQLKSLACKKNNNLDCCNLQDKNVEMVNILKFVLWGFWSIIFWPIIDKIILGDKFHLSFYLYGGVKDILVDFFTFFGEIKPVGILYGTRIETIFIIIIVGLYIYYKTKSFSRVAIGVVGVYTIFYLSVALPSILVFLATVFGGDHLMNITSLDVVKFFNTPLQVFGLKERGFTVTFFYKISLWYNLIFVVLLFWWQYLVDKNIFRGLFRNIRWPQMIFNWGLFVFGLAVAGYYFPENISFNLWSVLVLINLFLSILFSWLFAVVINDIEDLEVDKISNQNRPLVLGILNRETYLNYGLVFLFLSLLLAITVNSKVFLLIFLWNLLTVVYSKYPFKLKRIPWVAGVISSFNSLLLFLIGYILISPEQSLQLFPWRLVLFLFGSYALILPIKDLKDIESDKQNEVWTVANLFGEKRARIYFGIIIFLVYIFSVFVLGNYNLFFPAVISGSISYWIVNNPKNSYDILLYKLLAIVVVYVLVVVLR